MSTAGQGYIRDSSARRPQTRSSAGKMRALVSVGYIFLDNMPRKVTGDVMAGRQ